MSIFSAKEKSRKYHASLSQLWAFSNEELEKWATDPNCIEKDECAAFLSKRLAEQARLQAERDEARTRKRAELQENPFDSRTEVSADATYIAGRIIKHLWIIFVLLPVVLGVLWALMK
jgi:hypothetical protein